MKYQDSVEQAKQKALEINAFLERHHLAAHPVNYTVLYEHFSGKNPELSQAIQHKLLANSFFDDFVMAELYSQWLTPHQAKHEALAQQVSSILAKLAGTADISSEAIEHYTNVLDQTLLCLESDAPERSKQSLHKVLQATHSVKASQLRLQEELDYSKKQCHTLRKELAQLKQERQLDPLTGLYNRQTMHDYLNLWLSENPERRIAAIAVDLDHFAQFNKDYGQNIGDVILSKVAHKVASYVQESGLPVRSGGEEFLLLLPDVDLRTASEIAEQIRRGVEKLRFISSKNKQTLPKMTISLGVSIYKASENWHQFLSRSAQVLHEAKQRGRNQVATETMLAH